MRLFESILSAVLLTIILWDLGFISALSASIPIGIWMNETRKASHFNKLTID
ncbi:MAG: hypothetical protein HRT67_01980 [Flavobacteriaceae bacterium]|nr:hypothetical protein [Flavobacteriaceae bacterium]